MAALQLGKQQRVPIITITLSVITTVFMVLQFIYPDVLNTLRREPEALSNGQWWRMATPLFVQADGWLQFAGNLFGLMVFGIHVEYIFGRVRFLILYFVTGLTGEVFGYMWEPHGAGNSIAVLGLVGGLFMVLLFRKDLSLIIAMFGVYFVFGLVFYETGNWVVMAVPVALTILQSRLQRSAAVRWWGSMVAAMGLFGAITLTVCHDIHGPSLLTGSCVAVLMFLFKKEFSVQLCTN